MNSEEATFSKLFNLILILELFNPNRCLVASELTIGTLRSNDATATRTSLKK